MMVVAHRDRVFELSGNIKTMEMNGNVEKYTELLKNKVYKTSISDHLLNDIKTSNILLAFYSRSKVLLAFFNCPSLLYHFSFYFLKTN